MYMWRGGCEMEQYLFSVTIALMVGIIVAAMIYIQNKKEKAGEPFWEGAPRYAAVVSPYRLPIYIFLMIVLWPIVKGRYGSASEFVLKLLSLFLHIGMYHGVLLLVIPGLRKKISARVCAVLWTLPTLLYVVLYTYFTGVSRPWLVISLPSISFALLFFVWGGGFVAVMLWKSISHLRFRKWILTSVEPVTDPVLLRLWEEEQVVAQVYQGYQTAQFRIPLVQSDRITTPLTIGLRRGSTYMVLPKKDYTEDEYRLIFRHELTHIGREDSGNKFFLTFCTAMCWFNPLMWMAMRQCASDLERSCDETVLLDADMETKKQYAYLLLRTAGDDRGFTTCLSASGSSMRYRLQSAMGTSKRYLGSSVAGLCVFVLFLGYGLVTMSYDAMTAGEAIYQKNNSYQLSWIKTDTLDHVRIRDEQVGKALRQYLSNRQVYRSTHQYSMGEERIELHYTNPTTVVVLSGQMMEIRAYGDERVEKQYHFEEALDWSYLYGVLGIEE